MGCALLLVSACEAITQGMPDLLPGDLDLGTFPWICTPENCSGCCADNVCHPGGANEMCGAAGVACLACASEMTCVDGSCRDSVQTACGGVSERGQCLDSRRLVYCLSATGSNAPQLVEHPCDEMSRCVDGDGWGARCEAVGCESGHSSCGRGERISECVDGVWRETDRCGRVGESCREPLPGMAVCHQPDGERLELQLFYEARGPNPSYSDWGTPFEATFPNATVLLIERLAGASVLIRDLAQSDAEGWVQVVAPWNCATCEVLILTMGWTRVGAQPAYYRVLKPDLPPGLHPIESTFSSTSSVKGWVSNVNALRGGPKKVTIRVADASHFARVFDYTRYVMQSSLERWPGRDPGSLDVWLGDDVSWSCGGCFWTGGGRNQIWMPGGLADQGYWSDAVIAHELGHWAMARFGTPPGEGGQHCTGVPVPPGMAWSEGWATWFSAAIRDNAIYFAKVNGSFFWFDIDAHRYSSGTPWLEPSAFYGIYQMMDENAVASMLWRLSQRLGAAPLEAALVAPRMNQSVFARAYTRRLWALNANCVPVNLMDTGVSAPFLADFLDALVCAGVSRQAIDAATEPAVRYPYPSDAPLCP